ncbi:multi-sensor signal transduction histidine kinase [Richelia sinica FACHB-800]|uniref:histidine kinase n=1 Tax=Richelia sinica FACHB-800 TaxID=1357546 RepID=A0A975Y7L1_9NOST|nr:GAF domain-containing protein [Richelia sinica]MBD2663832.1 GAF domain-containing protein [Richelia sinica FACHB-800]QXE26460.1 multi-sensor signal transduction histidine kinase [Richelia sinica FACHB-800]
MVETVKLLHQSDYPQEAITLLPKVAAHITGMFFQLHQCHDGSQTFVYVSSGCRELCEIEPEVFQADFSIIHKLILPQDLESFIESTAVAMATLKPWNWEGRIVTPSGQLKWVQGSSQVQPSTNGTILWEGLLIDITDKKQAETKLQATEARYQALLAAIPDLMFRISRDGNYLEMKRDSSNCPLLHAEILGKNLHDILPSDVATVGQKAIARTLSSGTWQTWEYQMLTPLGMRDYQARLVANGKDEVLAIVRDITEYKYAAAQLQLSAQRDRLLTETLARIRSSLNLDEILQVTVTEVRQFLRVDRVFIGLNDAHGGAKTVAESVNPKYPSILGWSEHEKNYYSEIKSLFATNRVRVVEDTAKIAVSPKLKSHYQKTQTKASLAVPIILEDELLGALIANQCSSIRHWQSMEIDLLQQLSEQLAIAIQQSLIYQKLATLNSNLERQVAERTGQLQQKMQELEELHRVKDVVLHTVAHDLRTSVMGNLMVFKHLINSRELRATNNSDPVMVPVSYSILERMLQGNERQLGMIDLLLEIHSSQQQGVALEREPVKFNTLIGDILTELQPLFSQNQATITNLITTDLPTVMVDAARLQRVMTNLFDYSLQHNPPGLNFTLKAKMTGGVIRIQIQDNGTALSKLECDRLFDLYVRDPQGPGSTSHGLKMYLCRQIIQAHGGEIGVNRSQQQGISFWFTLPLMSEQA